MRNPRRWWSARRTDPADVVAADVALTDALESLDDADNYRDWILDLAAPGLLGAQEVLEVGAGRGTFTAELARDAAVTAVELGSNAAAELRARFSGSTSVRIVEDDLSSLPDASFDAAFLSNVLEHIEDDVGALRTLAGVVRPGGSIIVFSPAFPLLYSTFDARIGHHHRYRLPELRRRFVAAGLDVVDSRYVNSVGFFSWLLLVRLLGVTPGNRSLVQVFDRRFVPVLRRVERRRRPPFGQSVLIIGRVRRN